MPRKMRLCYKKNAKRPRPRGQKKEKLEMERIQQEELKVISASQTEEAERTDIRIHSESEFEGSNSDGDDDDSEEQEEPRRKKKKKDHVTPQPFRPRPKYRLNILPSTTSMPMIVPEEVIAAYKIDQTVDILLGMKEFVVDAEGAVATSTDNDDTPKSDFIQVKTEPIEEVEEGQVTFFQKENVKTELYESETEIDGVDEPNDIEHAVEENYDHSVNGEMPNVEPPSDSFLDKVTISNFRSKNEWLKEMDETVKRVILEFCHVIGREPKEYHLFYITIYRYLEIGSKKGYISSRKDVCSLWEHYDNLGDHYFKSSEWKGKKTCSKTRIFSKEYDGTKSNYLQWYIRCRDFGDTKAYFGREGNIVKEEMVPRNKNFYNLDAIWRHIVKEKLEKKERTTDLQTRLYFFRFCTDMTNPKDVCRMSVLWLRLNKGLKEITKRPKRSSNARLKLSMKYADLPPEERQQKVRMERFLATQARLASMTKEERKSYEERMRENRKEKYKHLSEAEKKKKYDFFVMWKASLTGEKKEKHDESIRRALKKYNEKRKEKGIFQCEEWKSKMKQYWKKKLQEETSEERERRLLKYKINQKQRKEKKIMEEEGRAPEVIKARMEEIRKEMGWVHLPDRRRGRKPGVNYKRPKQSLTSQTSMPAKTETSEPKPKRPLKVSDTPSVIVAAPSRKQTPLLPVPTSPTQTQQQQSPPSTSQPRLISVMELFPSPRPVQIQFIEQADPAFSSDLEILQSSSSSSFVPIQLFPLESITFGDLPQAPTSQATSVIVSPQTQAQVQPHQIQLHLLQSAKQVPVSVGSAPNPEEEFQSSSPSTSVSSVSKLHEVQSTLPSNHTPETTLLIPPQSPVTMVTELDEQVKDLRSLSPHPSSPMSVHNESSEEIIEPLLQLPSTPLTPTKTHDSEGKPLGPNMCDQCGATFVRIYELRCHKVDVHKATGVDLNCPECGYPCRKSSTLWYHYTRYHLGPRKIEEYPEDVKSYFVNKPFKPHLDSTERIKQNRGENQANICDHCGKNFSQTASLQEHIRRVHQGQVYKCDLCNRNHQSPGKLWRHKVEFHQMHDLPPPPGVTCINCKYCKEPVMRGYKTHVEKKHADKLNEFLNSKESLIKVGGCPKSAQGQNQNPKTKPIPPSVMEIIMALTPQNREELVSCPICNLKIRRRLLKRHYYDKHRTEHPCPECGKVFGTSFKMMEHYWRMHAFHNIEEHLESDGHLKIYENKLDKLSDPLLMDVAMAECLVCQYPEPVKFSVKPEIRVHFIKHHPKIIHEYKRICKETPNMECENCSQKFFTELQLRTHLEEKYPEKQYVCKECGIFKKTVKERIAHEKLHSTASHSRVRGICHVCKLKVGGEVVDRDERLKKHVMMEHKDQFKSCDMCDYWTFDHLSLRSHFKSKHHVTEKRRKYYVEHTLSKMKVECSRCPEVLKLATVQEHLSTTHGVREDEYQCTHCMMSFKSLPNYVGHVEMVHNVPLEELVQLPHRDKKPDDKHINSKKKARRQKLDKIETDGKKKRESKSKPVKVNCTKKLCQTKKLTGNSKVQNETMKTKMKPDLKDEKTKGADFKCNVKNKKVKLPEPPLGKRTRKAKTFEDFETEFLSDIEEDMRPRIRRSGRRRRLPESDVQQRIEIPAGNEEPTFTTNDINIVFKTEPADDNVIILPADD